MAKGAEDKMNIIISTGTIFKILLIGLFAVGLFILRDLVLVVLTSVLIAAAIEPATKWFIKYKIPRLVAVLSVYLASALVLTLAFYFLLIPLIGQAANFLRTLPETLVIPEAWNPFSSLSQPVFENLSRGFSINDFLNQANQIVSGTFNFLGAISSLFGGLLSLVLIVILSFYLAVQEDGVAKFLRLISPVKYEDYVVGLWRRAEVKIGLWMQGQIILAVIIGVLTYLGLLLLSVPNALLLAFLAALMELIPVFGPIIAAVPAVALGFIDGGLTLALVVAGFYVIIQQFESQLIYPLVVRKVVGLSPIIVILALVVGFRLAGFLGVILSVPLATILLILVEDLEKKKRPRTAIDA
jgi:predicted PurR-regulated permease PerM